MYKCTEYWKTGYQNSIQLCCSDHKQRHSLAKQLQILIKYLDANCDFNNVKFKKKTIKFITPIRDSVLLSSLSSSFVLMGEKLWSVFNWGKVIDCDVEESCGKRQKQSLLLCPHCWSRVCLSVCLSNSIVPELHVQSSPTLLCILP